ncbi:MAG: NifU family protein [Actinobacteria bacterium]|nr:NifU family protein [Actinomycetota bacterium]
MTATCTDPVVDEPVALHPERTEDARTLRWQVAGAPIGELCPTALDALVTEGVLTDVTVGRHHVDTTLQGELTWAQHGARVRDTVSAAVAALRAAGADRSLLDPDGELRRIAYDAIEQDVNPYAAGHGGGVALRGVHDGVVEVELSGTCRGCPAAAFTVQGRLLRRLKVEAPWTAEVRAVQSRRG